MRQGQLEADMFVWMALVFAIIFGIMTSITLAVQNYTGKPIDFFSPNPGTGNRIDVETQTVQSIRKNSVLPVTLLTAPYTADKTLKEAIQQKLYCEKSGALPPPPSKGCGFTDADFASEVRAIFPDVKYELTVSYPGVDPLEAERYPDKPYSSGPTVYQTYIAMPGGTNAELTLRIDGPQGIVRWTK